MKSFNIFTIGCQQNAHDSIKLTNTLKRIGLTEMDPANADLVIIVACAVRQTGVDRIYGNVENWQGKKILLTGCVLDSDKKKLKKRGVNFFDIEDPKSLAKLIDLDKKDLAIYFDESFIYSNSIPIMYGCDNFCSYCATPYTRGRERSLDFESIIDQAKTLIGKGSKSILLLGQNVNSYKDIKTNKRFVDILETLNDLDGDCIISFTSNHPKDMSDKIIEAVASLPKIKKEIHLPIQSGSDKILKDMNRPYKVDEYLKIIKNIRSIAKDLGVDIKITTDVIVGFPTETNEDFKKTVNLFKLVKYETAYINKYSPRVGTAAFKLGDPIKWSEKQKRWHKLNDIVYKKKVSA